MPMSRPPLPERVAATEALRPFWPTLLREVSAFAQAAPDGSPGKLGRFETFAFLHELPDKVAAAATREAERPTAKAMTNGHHAESRR